jgi:hypothetical protein
MKWSGIIFFTNNVAHYLKYTADRAVRKGWQYMLEKRLRTAPWDGI